MKTKIIYISGAEVFEMADVRAAFEEVRVALGLGADTILFGVPVDADDSVANAEEQTVAAPVTAVAEDVVEEIAPVAENTPNPAEIISQTDAPAPRARRTRGRAARAAEPTDSDEHTSDVATDATPVVPILSVLATGGDIAASSDAAVDEVVESVEIEPAPSVASIADTDDDIVVDDDDIVAPIDDDVVGDDDAADHVSIEDIIDDDMPAAVSEKTLEELLESMTPLREDHVADDDFEAADVAADSAVADDVVDDVVIDTIDDTDATLEQLATEFVESADKIPPAPKPSGNGKMGKLKNILPFKKTRRDDTGIMGDLFGWAGIAANDDDFSIPGFFTQSAAKK